jgi:hypothetical protein
MMMFIKFLSQVIYCKRRYNYGKEGMKMNGEKNGW